MEAEGDVFEHAPAKSALKDVAYGSVSDSSAHPLRLALWLIHAVVPQAAGIVSKLFEHPFDLVKVRLQSQPFDQPLKFNGPWDCMIKTFKKEGLLGLWRGVSMPVGGAMAENATLFVVYNQTQAFLRRLSPPSAPLDPSAAPVLNFSHLAISAAAAGACASFVLTPVELVKCKMQVQGSLQPSSVPQGGPVSIFRSILKVDGIRGLWLGQTGTLIRETGGSVAWFSTFEFCSSQLIERRHRAGQVSKTGVRVTKADLSALELMASGAAAGVSYNCVLFPADCIKSTIQVEDEMKGARKLGEKRRSFVQVGKDIYRARGIKGLYQGCGLTALRAAPSSALIFYMLVVLGFVL
ncbi:BQ5605_C010g05969 [Microbotryum silenes-dioicae]|uniref:BQ5605_C010g05969 protein n=1 Tax=Microbotryum silenes-dioicae TaxID=796604 RepID=A0A2X0LUB6_9BASI|nr:BQ5605_C010g05969 [Microbotryum silenes-dioicae]